MRIFHRHKGFSLLMALGITAVLLIMVVGLALVYMRELKLSRLSYDEVLSSASAEGLFEYGMLKVRNHADGFQDSVRAGSGEDFDADGKMFALSELRSAGMSMEYSIEANSTGATFTLSGGEHLIIPLFVDTGEKIKPGSDSKKPQKNTSSIENTE